MKINKVYIIIVILFSLLNLFACKKVKHKIITPNKFARVWYSIDGYLKINSANTFEYVRYTCISQSKSKGKWQILNDTLILNSITPNGCYFIENFKIEPPKDTITLIPMLKSKKDCQPNIGYVILKNEKFYLKDTLLMSKNAAYYDDGEFNHHTNFRNTSYYGY